MKYVDLMQPLEPCPFCGKRPVPRINARGGSLEHFFLYEIKCDNCKISMSKSSSYVELQKGLLFSEVLQDMAEVVNKWNTRGTNNEN